MRVVVLAGAGGKAFVSGADVSKFESERASLDATKIYNTTVERANSGVYDFPKPTIAMIQGYGHRRRGGARGLLRPAHRLRQFALRGAGRQARARLAASTASSA